MSAILPGNPTLSEVQRENAQKIIDYGYKNGFSKEEIQIAIQVAWAESDLNNDTHNSESTASGLYQYTDLKWGDYNGKHNDKDDVDNQIAAFYGDLARYRNRYNDPSRDIPRDFIDFGEYVYLKHHDGNSGTDWTNSEGLAYWHKRFPDTNPPPSIKPDNGNHGALVPDEMGIERPGLLPNHSINPDMNTNLDKFKDPMGNGTVRIPVFVDPLTLDLDGDGVETTPLAGSSAMFDLDGDDFAERTGWIGKDDGLLAMDINNNGKIDDITELFGNKTENGFDALKKLDGNVISHASTYARTDGTWPLARNLQYTSKK
ncbi:MAG: hypothetical protein HZA20_04670 [Nitrospirae bacterium]|nr:hypothetical protein [Nitrospirota bacterium]